MSLKNTLAAWTTITAAALTTTGCNTAERGYDWVNSIGRKTCASVMDKLGDKADDVYDNIDEPDRDECLEAAEPLAAVQVLGRDAQLICLDSVSQQTAEGIQRKVNADYRRACGTFVPTVEQ